MDRFEAAARGAYICFRSAGGKLIIVKRLWACYMEKALYKCTTFNLPIASHYCPSVSQEGLLYGYFQAKLQTKGADSAQIFKKPFQF